MSSRDRTEFTFPTDEKEARRFLLWFPAAAGVILSGILALSVWGNVWQDFGDTGFFTLYNDRRAKSEFLLRLPTNDLPQAWVLGSSNLMPFQPGSIQKRFGYKTFNLGVFWGRIEDSWCWLNYILDDLHSQPKLLILGVEPWTFGPGTDGPALFPHLSRRLLNTPLLVRHLDEYSPTRHALSKLGDGISGQHILSVIELAIKRRFQRRTFKSLEDSGVFLTDGTAHAYNRSNPASFYLSPQVERFYKDLATGALKAGDPSVEAERNRFLDIGLNAGAVDDRTLMAYMPSEGLRPQSIALFRRLIGLCQERNIRVAIIVMPTQPFFYDALCRETHHRRNLDALIAMLHDVQRHYSVVSAVTDASHISRFGGDPAGFHDNFHMTPANCERVLDLVQQQMQDLR
jgi:hypothetical protein